MASKKVKCVRSNGKTVYLAQGGKAHGRYLAAKKAGKASGRARRRKTRK